MSGFVWKPECGYYKYIYVYIISFFFEYEMTSNILIT